MKHIFYKICLLICMSLAVGQVQAQVRNSHRTTSKSRKTTTSTNKRKQTTSTTPNIVGTHMLSLQWLSWTKFGSCTIEPANANGEYVIHGKQMGGDEPDNVNDYLKIDGIITFSDPYKLKFKGTIRTKVYHIAGGNEVIREGEYDFERTGSRKYWRLQQMTNPVDPCTDYVDIYFK